MEFIESCYMCDSPSSTREHAPPLCVFPESKDLGDGSNLRKNLITVPSCAEHNLRYSNDDEYFLVIVTSNLEGNARREEQFGSKVIRALQRSPAFIRTTFQAPRPATVNGQPSMLFTVDRARVERVIEKVTRAIHYHHTGGRKLLAKLRIILPTLRTPTGSIDERVVPLEGLLQRWPEPWIGDNPEVFTYRLNVQPNIGGSFLQMSFYEGFAALVSWADLSLVDAG
jgi:hypothetical protein